ncbi:glycosyltransferase [Xanthomonas translucens]|uniref:glycosyltransferase n=1 Tax=Xanthomonas campestris pv. translucens TaxID=343 RepID=UPI001F6133A8|nr:glycosyltransferase [Xanthomonas translucens]UNU10110.1 glycosyltransferase [Xanthomonas translucens pv. translucens]
MSMSWANLRYALNRFAGLLRRGLASLRARGWRSTWERLRVHALPLPPPRRTLFAVAPQPFAAFAVPASDAPLASIVIPVYNHVAHTLACLRALAAHPPTAACEILVIDDGSSDETVQWLPQIQGLHYHVRSHNGGFIASCNDGAARARGRYVVFLNNDTVPQPGWLDALLETFMQVPQAGLVTAQLLYPDGRLQEAGGVVFVDGSAWSYGRFESPDDPRYAYLRDIDYGAGAALAIERERFLALGGFDTRYMPAYYEDTDLAFAVRQAGLRTLLQPASQVVHDEGTSNGTDTDSGIKAYQVRNRGVFAAKWADVLAQQLPPGTTPTPAQLHRQQRQVLILDEALPQPDRDSASLRQLNLIRLLLQEGAHVVFVPSGREYASRHSEALQRLGVEVWYAPYLKSVSGFLQQHGARFHAVLLVRHHVAHACLPLLRRFAPQARRLFDTVDLHYLRERRGAELAGDARLLREAERTRARELEVMAQVDVTVLVSGVERAQLQREAPQVRTALISNLHEVAGPGLPWAQRRDLVFVGGFRHAPNVDAVRWFLQEVFPPLRALLPELRFHCIGADMPDDIRRLGAATPGVALLGYVPDITAYMDEIRIAVAPLRFGAGVKGKVNLSMAHGQPVVATPCAVEGMHLCHGEDVLIAETAPQFVAALAQLYTDEALWNTLAGNGLRNIATHFSLDAARATVRQVFLE